MAILNGLYRLLYLKVMLPMHIDPSVSLQMGKVIYILAGIIMAINYTIVKALHQALCK
jgi:hypothetical protein